jgi:hypothetical protein
MHVSQYRKNCCECMSCESQWLYMSSHRRGGTSLKLWNVLSKHVVFEQPRSEWTRFRKQRTLLSGNPESGFAPHGVPEVYLWSSALVLCGRVLVRRLPCGKEHLWLPSSTPKITGAPIFCPRGIFYPRMQGAGD